VRADATVRIRREDEWIRVHGRLLPGVSLEQAQAAVSAVMSGRARRYPTTNAFRAPAVEPYLAMGARGRDALRIATAASLGITLMVLLVVCLNVSGMVQVRTAFRERELAIRQAIGATRGRLLRYQMSEALMLAGLGGALGIAVLFAGPRLVMWGIDQQLPRQILDAIGLTLPIAAATVGLAVAVSLMFGLWPALRFSRPAISALKDDAGGGRRRVGRVQRATAALQIGLATPFLVISGLMVEEMRTTATADFGFTLEGLAAVSLQLDDLSRQDRTFFHRAARVNLSQVDGVRSVTVADGMPLDFDSRRVRVSRPGADVVTAHVTRVDDGFFETLGIRIRRGRGISADDRDGRERVAVVSPALAERLFGSGEAIGQRVAVSFAGADPQDLTVIGVTADFVSWQIGDDPEQLLVPLDQHPVSRVLLIARTDRVVSAAWWTAAFQRGVEEVNREVPPGPLILGGDLRRNSMDRYLAQSAIAGGGGSVALLLGALGVYGVIGFTVASRSREIAVRMALGASRSGVIQLVLRDVLRLALPGVAFGLLPVLLFRIFVSLPTGLVEPLIYLVAGTVVAGVALLAGLPAALRAASVAPMGAMRSE
jgi:predicted permease